MSAKSRDEFEREIERKQRRKERARRHAGDTVWFGLGMFGLIGWSVSIPILLGVAIGLWLDSRLGSELSWTLMMLGAGVIGGAVHAWYWISKERDEMRRDDD